MTHALRAVPWCTILILTIVNSYCVVAVFSYMQRYDNQVQNMQGRGK